MTGKRVSAEQIKVVNVFVREPSIWFDGRAVARDTELPAATIRHFLLTFFRFGLLERIEVHGGYRYRLSRSADTQPYFGKLQKAAAVIEA